MSKTPSSLPWIIIINTLLICILASVLDYSQSRNLNNLLNHEIDPITPLFLSTQWVVLFRGKTNLYSGLWKTLYGLTIHTFTPKPLPLTIILATLPFAHSAPATLPYVFPWVLQPARYVPTSGPLHLQSLCWNTFSSVSMHMHRHVHACTHTTHTHTHISSFLFPNDSFINFICVILPHLVWTPWGQGFFFICFVNFCIPSAWNCAEWTMSGWVLNECFLCTPCWRNAEMLRLLSLSMSSGINLNWNPEQ